MIFEHNNIDDDKVRLGEEKFNLDFIEGLGLKTKVDRFEGFDESSKNNDSSPYMTVWLQNIDRLIDLLPNKIDLNQYHLCDVGCGIGISTIYFAAKYNLKSYSGFDFNKKLINEANRIKNNIDMEEKINFEVADANEKILDKKPQLLFMFNPFGVKTLKNFIDNNEQNLKNNKSFILYANDLWINEIKKSNLINRNHFYNLSSIEF